jgi:hypothetical protein
MIVLRIEHKVLSFDAWKKAFDSDPIDRKKSGVRRYQIYQPVDDPKYVIIDLECDSLSSAQATQTALQNMMTKAIGTLIVAPSIRILSEMESKEY